MCQAFREENKFVAKPCAIALNIQANGPQIAQPNAILEKVFTAITKHPDEKRLEGLSKQLDWDVRSIQRWFRQRCNQEKPSTLRKFCESMCSLLRSYSITDICERAACVYSFYDVVSFEAKLGYGSVVGLIPKEPWSLGDRGSRGPECRASLN
ncbi:hypothetical protein PANDA_004646 [Ailuropoda melanoleuca]|uniref:sphingosine N-acyltransferase n=1 Tax=Ailuropoda melanoleuca TaxID=9646 RepID=D2H4D9_AILME|nr:hypothetical protein PANDA_004646 [Ailuropoda melanoleuca]